jgi:hypothetical protein
MRTFYTLHVHRKDGSWQNHVMQGEVPKVGDTVSTMLASNKVSAKVGAVTDLPRRRRRIGAVEPDSYCGGPQWYQG